MDSWQVQIPRGDVADSARTRATRRASCCATSWWSAGRSHDWARAAATARGIELVDGLGRVADDAGATFLTLRRVRTGTRSGRRSIGWERPVGGCHRHRRSVRRRPPTIRRGDAATASRRTRERGNGRRGVVRAGRRRARPDRGARRVHSTSAVARLGVGLRRIGVSPDEVGRTRRRTTSSTRLPTSPSASAASAGSRKTPGERALP